MLVMGRRYAGSYQTGRVRPVSTILVRFQSRPSTRATLPGRPPVTRGKLAHARDDTDDPSQMPSECEICKSLRACTGALVTSASRGLSAVPTSDRALVLCAEHASLVERGADLKSLRRAVLEPFPGRRSLIPRRTELSGPTRAVPGRRATDPSERGVDST